MKRLISLVEQVFTLYGWPKAARVVDEYKFFVNSNPHALRDLAIFCNAGAMIQGDTEFDRGVEEGKRRVWLHIARMAGLEHVDFVNLADGSAQQTMRTEL